MNRIYSRMLLGPFVPIFPTQEKWRTCNTFLGGCGSVPTVNKKQWKMFLTMSNPDCLRDLWHRDSVFV